jgi:hypothetical protein
MALSSLLTPSRAHMEAFAKATGTKMKADQDLETFHEAVMSSHIS